MLIVGRSGCGAGYGHVGARMWPMARGAPASPLRVCMRLPLRECVCGRACTGTPTWFKPYRCDVDVDVDVRVPSRRGGGSE